MYTFIWVCENTDAPEEERQRLVVVVCRESMEGGVEEAREGARIELGERDFLRLEIERDPDYILDGKGDAVVI